METLPGSVTAGGYYAVMFVAKERLPPRYGSALPCADEELLTTVCNDVIIAELRAEVNTFWT
jgi:hypothetical protein